MATAMALEPRDGAGARGDLGIGSQRETAARLKHANQFGKQGQAGNELRAPVALATQNSRVCLYRATRAQFVLIRASPSQSRTKRIA